MVMDNPEQIVLVSSDSERLATAYILLDNYHNHFSDFETIEKKPSSDNGMVSAEPSKK